METTEQQTTEATEQEANPEAALQQLSATIGHKLVTIANGGEFDSTETTRDLARFAILLNNRLARYESTIGIVDAPSDRKEAKKK